MEARTFRIWLTTALFLFLGFYFSSVRAQDLQQRWGVGFYGSGIKMVLGQTDLSTIEQWAGMSIRYGFSSHLAMELNGAYGWVYPRKPGGSQFAHTSHYHTLLTPVWLNWVYVPFPNLGFRPFVSLGGGLLDWEIRDIKNTTSFIERGEYVKGDVINGILVAGIGLEKFFADKVGASLFFRFHYIFKGNEDTIGLSYEGGPSDDNRAVVEAGLEFKFYNASHKDTDGDGIEDRLDLDPLHPEDFDNYMDYDGEPDYDNDGDGIPDSLDHCPNRAEDLDGFQDKDGCPDYDNDKDGIPDSLDHCPNKAEDIDGFQDKDGCPDLDNDQDGIPDVRDKCPNEPETVNGYKDDDGCPDKKPAPPMKKGAHIILRGVNFESGSAALTPESYAVLDTVYESLARNPEVEVEIRGYTDNVGSWKYNLRLSQKRAEAVRQYLVNRGIDPKRLRAVGYGEADPIATNATARGRAENRRIEFVRIK